MTDKYCQNCKYFEWQRAQPVCMRQQHRLIDGWRISGCALDAEMERIAPNGCGQDARYFEPKSEPSAPDHPGSEYDCLFSAYRLLEAENASLRQVIKDINDTMMTNEPLGEWINSDRLPPEWATVLGRYPEAPLAIPMLLLVTIKFPGIVRWFSVPDYNMVEPPTHWMPLPPLVIQ